MPLLAPSGVSCAVRNLTKFAAWADPGKMLMNLPGLLDSRAPYIIFTAMEGSERGDYGTRLRDFITGNGFGQVTSVGPAMNHTGNNITLYVWIVDYEAIAAWFLADQKKREAERNGTSKQQSMPEAA